MGIGEKFKKIGTDFGTKTNIKKTWKELDPNKKRKLIIFVVIGVILLFALIAYNMRTHNTSPTAKEKRIEKKDISLEPKLLEKSKYNEAQKMFEEMKDSIKDLNEKISQIEQEKNSAPSAPSTPSAPPDSNIPVPSGATPPPHNLPVQPPSTFTPPPGQITPAIAEMQQPKISQAETFGDIEIVSQKIDEKEQKDKKDKKKELLKIYLPPSFMEATLLSGLDAPTSEGAQGHPSPVLLRIKDLAVLPNKVKANLKGCFLIAEGYGNLSDERAHLRLASLSCLSKKGQSVIDQKVKGFVVDSDGKIGLRGKVVAKFGSKIAMSLMAGLFQGAGDALRDSTTTTYYGSYGASQIIDTDELGRQALGGALAQAAKELQKFYLELGKQSLPIIEVGAMKNITIVISEGVTLEVKERGNACIGGKECEK